MSKRLFSSWARRGAAAAITEADPIVGPWPGAATFVPSITVTKDGVAQPDIPGPPLALLGSAAVTGLNRKMIVRIDPRDGATGVEDNYLVQIEFARADLPWLFTPARPNADNRLRPWLVLIVLESAKVQLQPGTPLPRISVNDSELPDLNDSWGWAHVQATVDDPARGDGEFTRASGTSAISRLLCPRRLKPDSAYLACVVPATRPAVQAGLGQPPDPGPAVMQAWTAGAGQDVVLPVYYSWRFATGDDGDFKSLAQRLRGARALDIAGFGTRTVDMSAPWQRGDQLAPGTTVALGGALGIGAEHPLPAEVQGPFASRLTRLLNFPADLAPANAAGNPELSAVAPPIYGGRHAASNRVPVAAGWLQTLNLDPRRRIAAAYGTRYVQENQEFLMAQAWDQLGAVQEANRLQALAELAAEVGDRVHRRHIAGRSLSSMVAVAAPARTRVLVAAQAGPALTLQATAATSAIPSGAATVAFSRVTRALGPLGRRTFDRSQAAVVEKGLTGTLKIASVLQDGIVGAPVAPPAASFATPTAALVTKAWQSVASIEQSIPAANVAALLQATNNVARPPSPNPKGLALGIPVVRFLSIAPKPVAQNIAAQMTTTLAASLTPSEGIFKRFRSRVRIPDGLGMDNAPGAKKAARVMACPQFIAPLALAVKTSHQDWLLPGLGNFPDNRVTLLIADGAFVESFLAGANHEMNREFLWRGYPTDQRGTPFRHFWPRPDRLPDIPPITNWPLANPLGKNGMRNPGEVEDMVVFLVRGEIMHRYPRLIVQAAPAKRDANGPTLDPEGNWVQPAFSLRLDDRTTAFAYNLTEDRIRSNAAQGSAGYYFVFAEPITGPRFNFDAAPNALKFWTDLDWDSVPQSRGFAIAGAPPLAVPQQLEGANWNRDAADVARIAFARPFRVGYHADELLPPPEVPPGN